MSKRIMAVALFCCVMVFVGAANADQMSFAISGAGLDASGTFYGAPAAPGQWLIDDAAGIFNGANIIGIWPESNSGNVFAFDNLYFSPEPMVDWAGIVFKLDNGDMVNLCYDSGCAGAAGTYTAIVWDPVSGITDLNVDTYQFGEPTPEPGTLILFGGGLIGLSRVARRVIAR